jgi:hypothetical protein
MRLPRWQIALCAQHALGPLYQRQIRIIHIGMWRCLYIFLAHAKTLSSPSTPQKAKKKTKTDAFPQ